MKLTRLVFVALTVAVLGLAGGCAKKKEITSLQRKEAATLISEAQFALTVREFARAEGLFAKATELCPDNGSYWTGLGSVRMKMGQREPAKTAYGKALKAFEEEAAVDKSEAGPALEQVTVLALMGRVPDARALLEKLPARYPENRNVRGFIESKTLDRLLADPKFKEVAL